MPPRKEEEKIKIPEAVINRASDAAMRGQAIADTGSIFTNRERSVDFRGAGAPSFSQQGGLPRFPFGGASSTSLDITNRNFDFGQDAPAGGFTRTNPSTTFASTQNQANVQYTQDAASRIANRYTLPTDYFNNPFGSRLSNTLYSNPQTAANIENRRAELNTYNPLPSSPDVGAAGFRRNIETGAGGRVEQIVSPYGFASTNLTPQQVEQRAQARQQAEQMGTIPRTPEQQQALLAQMRERGAAIGQRIAEEGGFTPEAQRNRYYAFRQRLEERRAQEALTPSFGTTVGREATMRGTQALVEAERWKLAQSGRNPMSQEPISVMGLQFRRGSMGQYFPIRGLGSATQPVGISANAPTATSSPPMIDTRNEFGNAFRFSLYNPLPTS